MRLNSDVKILSCLPPYMLAGEAVCTSYPKWNTLCLLRHLSMPTLDAMFIPPGTNRYHIIQAASMFMGHLGQNELVIRSDGGREGRQYFFGGASLPIEPLISIASELSASNRALIFLEPTNRFNNRLSVNILISSRGSMHIELLGPGYDVSDLNRGGVLPLFVIKAENVNWKIYERLWRSDFFVSLNVEDESRRRAQRLNNIGSRLLKTMGVEVSGPPDEGAAAWLKSTFGSDQLGTPAPSLTLSQLRHWYDEAFEVAQFVTRERDWHSLVLSGSDLGSRFIWWDIADAGLKYSAP